MFAASENNTFHEMIKHHIGIMHTEYSNGDTLDTAFLTYSNIGLPKIKTSILILEK